MCFVVLVSASNLITPAAAEKTGKTCTVKDVATSVVIYDAYYSNLDGDVEENDIVGCFNIILSGASVCHDLVWISGPVGA